MTSCLCLSGWLHTLCSGDNDCERSNAKCYKGECLCTPGFYYSVGNETCVDCEFTSRAAPRCTGAAMFHLGWLSLAALYWVFSRFLARLLLRSISLTIGRLTHTIVQCNCLFKFMVQKTCQWPTLLLHFLVFSPYLRLSFEFCFIAYTYITLVDLSSEFCYTDNTYTTPVDVFTLHSPFFWTLLHSQHLYNTC